MPAIEARIMVEATVVAPSSPLAMIKGMSLREHLITSLALPKYSISSELRPTLSLPFKIAIVAGMAPFSLTIFSTLRAVSTFLG